MTETQKTDALAAIDRLRAPETDKQALREQVNAGNPSALFVLLKRRAS